MVAQLVDGLAASGITAWAAGGSVYPLANVVHLLGLVMLLGSIALIDLRIIGAFAALPAPALVGALTPIAITGFGLMLLSGSTMFAADAGALVGHPGFRWKLAAIIFALANAAAFRWLLHPGAARRVSAALSLATWLVVAWLGRMIAYS